MEYSCREVTLSFVEKVADTCREEPYSSTAHVYCIVMVIRKGCGTVHKCLGIIWHGPVPVANWFTYSWRIYLCGK